MKVLLSDGASLTARQCATRLARAGHRVDVLASNRLCLSRYTRWVRRVHRVPRFGADPIAWLDAARAVYGRGAFDFLFPTQEQVAVLSFAQALLERDGIVTAVPDFSALCRVQDKVAASATLRSLGVPQPETGTDPGNWTQFPAFVKEAVGTASGGVRLVRSRDELDQALSSRTEVVIQAPATGPLVMCQSVFDRGTLVAFHANERTGEGAGGGASHKLGITFPAAREHLERLGAALGWHGALSADVIRTDGGPRFIDINPRLVEPQNAYLSGVDLVAALLAIGSGQPVERAPRDRPGVASHQLLLGILGAAGCRGSRRDVAREVLQGLARRGSYANSVEELTPCAGDPLAAIPVAVASAATLLAPSTWSYFAGGSVANYSLSPSGWDELLRARNGPETGSRTVPPENGRDGK